MTLGDSITDGSVNLATGERGWAGTLARRLQTQSIAVVIAGIGGNRLVQSMPMFGAAAVDRFDRDVLSVPGLRCILVLEGINDIGMNGPGGVFGDTPVVDPHALIDAYSQIIRRAHERGLKVFGATIMPFEGADYYSAEKEQVRQVVNEWIRTSNAYDALIDFDKTVRDAAAPYHMSTEYDSGDHLHPSPEGYRAQVLTGWTSQQQITWRRSRSARSADIPATRNGTVAFGLLIDMQPVLQLCPFAVRGGLDVVLYRRVDEHGLRAFLDRYGAQRIILRHASSGDLAVGDVKHVCVGDDTVDERLLNDEPLVLQFACVRELLQMYAVQLQLTHDEFDGDRTSGKQLAALL